MCKLHGRAVVDAGALWSKIAAAVSPTLTFCPLGCTVLGVQNHTAVCTRRASVVADLVQATSSTIQTVGTHRAVFVDKTQCIKLVAVFANGSPKSFDARLFYPTPGVTSINIFVLISSDMFSVDFSMQVSAMGAVPMPVDIKLCPDVAICVPEFTVEVTFEVPSARPSVDRAPP